MTADAQTSAGSQSAGESSAAGAAATTTTADPQQIALGVAAFLAFLGLYYTVRILARLRTQRQCNQEAEALRRTPRAFTPEELALYNGRRPEYPLLLAIKGRVLDVRTGADYYGPDGPYKVMAGCDASRAFALMSLKQEDALSDLSGVDDDHLKILEDWYDKLTAKYPTVGCCANNAFGYKLPKYDPNWVSSADKEKDD